MSIAPGCVSRTLRKKKMGEDVYCRIGVGVYIYIYKYAPGCVWGTRNKNEHVLFIFKEKMCCDNI